MQTFGGNLVGLFWDLTLNSNISRKIRNILREATSELKTSFVPTSFCKSVTLTDPQQRLIMLFHVAMPIPQATVGVLEWRSLS